MIFKESCDIDAENLALHQRNKLHFYNILFIFHNITVVFFYILILQIQLWHHKKKTSKKHVYIYNVLLYINVFRPSNIPHVFG